ncbi:MAG: methylenetetrahydrofolate reductase [Actinobacteria bacterium]|nr:methylenetetrahydrofolate reductase [Actinomycetota bacterium]
MSRLRTALEAGEFVITGELSPPLGTDVAAMRKSVDLLGSACHAINVTDNQGATLHMSSLGASKFVLDAGFEPIFQQTCRDRNRLALQSDLLAAWALGLENLLIVTGDDPRAGDHPQAKGVFDLDSTQLIHIAAQMNAGTDMLGRPLVGGTGFFIGAAAFPEAEPYDVQMLRASRKIAAGASYFQTQAIFDLDKLERATQALRAEGAWVIAGILLLKSPRVVDFVNNKLAGLMIPPHIEQRIKTAEDPLAEGLALAAEQVVACRDICDGVHIMPLGLDEAVARIVGNQ